MLGKIPAFQFYTGDWLKDPNLSKCLPATRGIWIDAIASMHENCRSGALSGTPGQLARVLRCTESAFMDAIMDLRSTGTADVTERNGIVTLINRRMYREAKQREANRIRQSRHRSESGCNDPVTERSRSPSSSSTDSKNPTQTLPWEGPSDLLPPALLKSLSQLTVDDSAISAQMAVKECLEAQGFACELEWGIPDRGDGMPGYIDVMATKGDLRIAIEIDRREPREKSIRKLLSIANVRRLMILRGGSGRYAFPQGIDAAIALRIKNGHCPARDIVGSENEADDRQTEFEPLSWSEAKWNTFEKIHGPEAAAALRARCKRIKAGEEMP